MTPTTDVPGDRRQVLVVEDELVVAMGLEVALEDLGWRVLGAAPTVARALDLVARRRPDVALLDVNLGDERVTPVAEALAARGVPFVLLTGYGRHHLPEPSLRDAPRLDKPVDARRLHAALLAAVDADRRR